MTAIREYNGEEHLILGCGNHPHKEYIKDHWCNEHQHIGEYTVDIDETVNPSCLVDFNKQKLPIPNQNSIIYIITEGVLADIQSDILIGEILRISNGKEDSVYLDLTFKSACSFRNWCGGWSHVNSSIEYGYYIYEGTATGFKEWVDKCRDTEKAYGGVEIDSGGWSLTYQKTATGEYQKIKDLEERQLISKCKKSKENYGVLTDEIVQEIGDVYIKCKDRTYTKIDIKQLYPIY